MLLHKITSTIISLSSNPKSLHFKTASLMSRLANTKPSTKTFPSKFTAGNTAGIDADDIKASTLLSKEIVSSKNTASP